MDTFLQGRTKSFSWRTVSDLTSLDVGVTKHLSNVFSTLAGLVAISALGAYFQIITNFSSTLSGVLTFVFLLSVIWTGFSSVSPLTVSFFNLV
jgi:hypothetical protein